VEAIIALPEQLFYNTGISTYVWVLSNVKDPKRTGTVQLIDASDVWTPMRKSLGDKRRYIDDDQIAEIVRLYEAFDADDERVKVFNTEDFGYRKIRVERPLRLNLKATPERIERLWDQKHFQRIAQSKKKDPQKKAKAIEEGQKIQSQIIQMLHDMSAASATSSTRFDPSGSWRRLLRGMLSWPARTSRERVQLRQGRPRGPIRARARRSARPFGRSS
jgi:type I restriction enzyme M protein